MEPDFYVCEDCLQYLVNDDLTGLDYHYDQKEAAVRECEIREGAAGLPGAAYMGEDADMEFSRITCECCSTPLAGPRYGFKEFK